MRTLKQQNEIPTIQASSQIFDETYNENRSPLAKLSSICTQDDENEHWINEENVIGVVACTYTEARNNDTAKYFYGDFNNVVDGSYS